MFDVFDDLASNSQSRMPVAMHFVEEEKIPYFKIFVSREVYLDLITIDLTKWYSDLYLRFAYLYWFEFKQVGKGNNNNLIVIDLYTYDRGILQSFFTFSPTHEFDLLLTRANEALQHILVLINNLPD